MLFTNFSERNVIPECTGTRVVDFPVKATN
jgi:hypothetical protein